MSGVELKFNRIPEQAPPVQLADGVIDLSAGDDRTFHGSKKFSAWPNCAIAYTVKIIAHPDQRIIAKIIGPAEDAELKAEIQTLRDELTRAKQP